MIIEGVKSVGGYKSTGLFDSMRGTHRDNLRLVCDKLLLNLLQEKDREIASYSHNIILKK